VSPRVACDVPRRYARRTWGLLGSGTEISFSGAAARQGEPGRGPCDRVRSPPVPGRRQTRENGLSSTSYTLRTQEYALAGTLRTPGAADGQGQRMPRNARVVIPPTCLFAVRKVSRGGSRGCMTPAPAGRSGPSDGRSVRELVFGSQGEILGRAPCKRNSGFVQVELTASPPGEKRILSVFLPLAPGSSRSVRARSKPARDRNPSFLAAAPIGRDQTSPPPLNRLFGPLTSEVRQAGSGGFRAVGLHNPVVTTWDLPLCARSRVQKRRNGHVSRIGLLHFGC
jgi:hypothetical protein